MALQAIHQQYDIPTETARVRLKAFRSGCSSCQKNLALPKSTPAAHIASDYFGERVLVDCKTVTGHGYLVVAVDHFTSFVWATSVKRKLAQPIADFVKSVWGDVRKIRDNRPTLGNDVGGKSSVLYASSSIGKVRVTICAGARECLHYQSTNIGINTGWANKPLRHRNPIPQDDSEAERQEDVDNFLNEEAKREREKTPIYQSDNGSELKNKIMKEVLQAIGVDIRHSREYNPRTNGKIENRIKEISRKVATELNKDVKEASEEDIRNALVSALAIMNFNVSSTSTFRPYEVRAVVNIDYATSCARKQVYILKKDSKVLTLRTSLSSLTHTSAVVVLMFVLSGCSPCQVRTESRKWLQLHRARK